ncbi:hypothetical protein [Paenibacillus sp. P46E]|uniref:hypothetical protein n=1 Tax=Paenibacillus sp. P46E TaxID=1349436 RepID=UPI000939B483|nr:hypothetical protein [Paenibacillus sp. P46E]OKP97795.1 hypothetical protein A3849_13915 [Paenibacillus sp. P46E]
MKRFSDKLHVILLIVLIIAISLDIMNGWKEEQLNQRYEDSLRQYEQANREYIEYLDSSRERVELMIRKVEQAALN